MTDIVTRMRDDYEKTVKLCAEAADEIERLERELAVCRRASELFTALAEQQDLNIAQAAEIDRLISQRHMVPDEDQKP